MEFIILFGILGIIFFWPSIKKLLAEEFTSNNQNNPAKINNNKAQEESGYELSKLYANKTSMKGCSNLQLDFRIDTVIHNESSFHGLAVFIEGTLEQIQSIDTRFRLMMNDKILFDHDSKGRILTDLEFLSDNNSGYLNYVFKMGRIVYRSALLSKRQILFIPFDGVEFPKKGNREYLFTLAVEGEINSKYVPLGLSNRRFNLLVPKDGYLDLIEKRKESLKFLIILSLLLAHSDGHIALKEVKIIEKWFTTLITDDVELDEYKTYISEQRTLIKDNHDLYSIDIILENFKSTATKKIIYEGLDLLVSVMAADSNHDTNERRIIDKFVQSFEISNQDFQRIFNKYLDTSIIENQFNANDFGIREDMSIAEKKKILREQYQIWSKRVTSQDEKTRKNAEAMIERIAKERSKLDV